MFLHGPVFPVRKSLLEKFNRVLIEVEPSQIIKLLQVVPPNTKSFKYNFVIFQGHGQSGVINDIALSKFHVLTMHQNAIVATCLLNNQLVFSDEFDRKDPILGFRQNSTEGRDSQTGWTR